MSSYDNDPRVGPFGADGYTVTHDGTDYQVLPTEVFGWIICSGPNLDFVPDEHGPSGFAIGFTNPQDAIGSILATATATATTATDTGTGTDDTDDTVTDSTGSGEDGAADTDGM